MFPEAWKLKEAKPPKNLEPRVRYVAYSGRFVLLSLRPLIAVYMGEESDHVIVDGVYCSCEGFQRRLSRGEIGCSHVYALPVALGNGRYTLLSLGPGRIARIVWEILTGTRSVVLRLALREKIDGRRGLGENVGQHYEEGVY